MLRDECGQVYRTRLPEVPPHQLKCAPQTGVDLRGIGTIAEISKAKRQHRRQSVLKQTISWGAAPVWKMRISGRLVEQGGPTTQLLKLAQGSVNGHSRHCERNLLS